MRNPENLRVILASRPVGVQQPEHSGTDTVLVPGLAPGQIWSSTASSRSRRRCAAGSTPCRTTHRRCLWAMVERHLLVKRTRMEGFQLFDGMDRYEEAVRALAGWLRSGQLRYREHVLRGLEAAPGAIAMLYRGENTGKLIIEVN
jgi:hypothetical protein